MRIRRPLAGLIVAVTLFGGGTTLAGCSDTVNAPTGTPKDSQSNTSGNNTSAPSQGHVPDNSGREPGSSFTDDGNP